jgi:diadenosine tetraphosphate (Ap4A) HIT family hydrolase
VVARTWPDDWEARKAGGDCELCAEGRPEVNVFGSRRVWRGPFADAYLRPESVPLGYTLVVWRGRHVAEPTELSDEEATGYWLEVLRVARGVERRYSPAKLNLQLLGNAVPHLHTHIVPRYVTDPDPRRPPDFVASGGELLPANDYAREVTALAELIAGPARAGDSDR